MTDIEQIKARLAAITPAAEYTKPDALPMEDPRYEVAPGIFSFSRWSRENVIKPEHVYQVGDEVVYLRLSEVTRLTRDCDGSPLYTLDHERGGVSEDSLLPAVYGDESIREDMRALLERIAELEAVVRRLVDQVPIDWDTFADHGNCGYCHKVITWSDCDDIGEHAPDCPWVAAQKLISPSK